MYERIYCYFECLQELASVLPPVLHTAQKIFSVSHQGRSRNEFLLYIFPLAFLYILFFSCSSLPTFLSPCYAFSVFLFSYHAFSFFFLPSFLLSFLLSLPFSILPSLSPFLPPFLPHSLLSFLQLISLLFSFYSSFFLSSIYSVTCFFFSVPHRGKKPRLG